jgi:hypothetical protein
MFGCLFELKFWVLWSTEILGSLFSIHSVFIVCRMTQFCCLYTGMLVMGLFSSIHWYVVLINPRINETVTCALNNFNS